MQVGVLPSAPIHKNMQDFVCKLTEKASSLKNETQSLRYGQCLAIALHILKPDLYKIILNTEYDCFYTDEKIPNFWDKIKQLKF